MKNREAGLVSIIVPVYRAAAYIADTIGMVFSQTYGRWELLLVDDCSGDGSVEAIEKTLSAYPHHPAAAASEKIGQYGGVPLRRGKKSSSDLQE